MVIDRLRASVRLSLLSWGLVAAAPVVAQTTWIVNAAGGPGVNFPDLPSAVAAAASGDTILVFAGPAGQGASSFTTDKGLTIVGVGGDVPIEPLPAFGQTFGVANLPAGQRFVMRGFRMQVPAHFEIDVFGCAGAVHFEDIVGYNFSLAGVDVRIANSAAVTLRNLYVIGSPAVLVDTSTVSLTSCELIGHPCMSATDSVVDVVQPLFTPYWVSAAAIYATNCALRIAGDNAASIPTGFNPSYPSTTVNAIGGSIAFDPAVHALPAGPSFSGTATVTIGRVPASWLPQDAIAAQTATIVSSAALGAVVFQALGAPGLLLPTPLGLLGIDAARPYAFFPAAVVAPSASSVTFTLPIPATIPSGYALATQSVVLDQGGLRLGAPCAFSVR